MPGNPCGGGGGYAMAEKMVMARGNPAAGTNLLSLSLPNYLMPVVRCHLLSTSTRQFQPLCADGGHLESGPLGAAAKDVGDVAEKLGAVWPGAEFADRKHLFTCMAEP